LIEKSTNNIVAEVITVNNVDVGRGLLEMNKNECLLKETAETVALEVVKMM
jgi:hypothetical protein